MLDVLIIGGGPAGLSAALILGRCIRRTLVCDSGRGRNKHAVEMHGYLTRDGISPGLFRELSLCELERYETVSVQSDEVNRLNLADGIFVAEFGSGLMVHARSVLLATGAIDHVPQIQNIERFYGSSVFHCPYCDGWEVRDKPLLVIGQGESGLELALKLKRWSGDISFCTNGPAALTVEDRERLHDGGIPTFESSVVSLDGEDGKLKCAKLSDGTVLFPTAIFFSTRVSRNDEFARMMGCRFDKDGGVSIDREGRTSVDGIFVAGDAAENVSLTIVAAAEGAKAAVSINEMLLKVDENWSTKSIAGTGR